MKVVSRHRTRWAAQRAADRHARQLGCGAPHVYVMRLYSRKRSDRHVVVESPR